MTQWISIILPAHNEAAHITASCQALLASPLPTGWQAEVIILANGCNDDTAAQARALGDTARAQGWFWHVLDLPDGNKLAALTAGDAIATGAITAYVDADVRVEPDLLSQLITVLDHSAPRYASGTPKLAPATSAVTRAYGRFWATLPFVCTGVPGFGVFAMNAAGRARWAGWPDIISDDTFARLNFAPNERVRVNAGYSWPMVEGFANLVRVRRRQNGGVSEVAQKYPQLLPHDDTVRLGAGGLLRRALGDPVGFAVYATVSIAVKTPLYSSNDRWARGR